jgi:acyl-CoA synthetase (AMP-forming)/AMP-acid ligase II
MDWLFDRFTSAASVCCLATEDIEYSYSDLLMSVRAAESAIRQANIPPGAVVSLVADYSLGAIAWLLALARHNVIVVPICAAVPCEVEARLTVARAEWLVDFTLEAEPITRKLSLSSDAFPLVQRLREQRRAGLILFSSGSTGEPKAMLHDLTTLIESYEQRRARQLRILVFLLFDHIGGLNTLLHSLASCLCLVIPRTRQPEAIAALIQQRLVNVLPASPTFLNLLLLSHARERYDLSSLRIITYGTEPMAQPLLDRLRAAFPKVRFVQTFGTSETGITQTASKSSGSTRVKIDDPNVETRIVDGELWIRSKTQILGYLNHLMDSFTPDGWFRTGDLVEAGSDGYLRIIGRQKEVINVGGLKVLPGEVETVLLEMPEIADCLVYAEPNPISGQVVAAQVVLSAPGTLAEIKSRVRAYCRTRLEPYKIPVRLRIVERTSFSERFKKSRQSAVLEKGDIATR